MDIQSSLNIKRRMALYAVLCMVCLAAISFFMWRIFDRDGADIANEQANQTRQKTEEELMVERQFAEMEEMKKERHPDGLAYTDEDVRKQFEEMEALKKRRNPDGLSYTSEDIEKQFAEMETIKSAGVNN